MGIYRGGPLKGVCEFHIFMETRFFSLIKLESAVGRVFIIFMNQHEISLAYRLNND